MLEKLLIEDFQNHERRSIHFDPRITCFLGPSDGGKSAILRSLKWLCTNQPSGEAFIRKGSTGSRVRLAVDGKRVTRSRFPGANIYKLDGREFRSFDNGVPEPISELLNIHPTSFQGQHDSPYWLSLSAGQVSRELNAVINLDVIDKSLGYVASEVRKAKAAEEVSHERIKAAEQEAEALAFVPDMLDKLDNLEALEQECQETRLKSLRIDSALEDVGRLTEAIRERSEAILALENVVSLAGQVMESQKRLERVERLLNECAELQDKIEQSRMAESCIEMEIADKMKGRCPICRKPVTKT